MRVWILSFAQDFPHFKVEIWGTHYSVPFFSKDIEGGPCKPAFELEWDQRKPQQNPKRKNARLAAGLFCLPVVYINYFFFPAFFAVFFAGAFLAAFLAGDFFAAFLAGAFFAADFLVAAFFTAKGIPRFFVDFLLLALFLLPAAFAALLPLFAPLLLFFAADFVTAFLAGALAAAFFAGTFFAATLLGAFLAADFAAAAGTLVEAGTPSLVALDETLTSSSSSSSSKLVSNSSG